jgi:uncharacterized Zn finger protein
LSAYLVYRRPAVILRQAARRLGLNQPDSARKLIRPVKSKLPPMSVSFGTLENH